MSALASTQSRPEAIGRDTTRGRWWGPSALALAAIITGLDITVVVTALPTLSAMNGWGDARVLGT